MEREKERGKYRDTAGDRARERETWSEIAAFVTNLVEKQVAFCPDHEFKL